MKYAIVVDILSRPQSCQVSSHVFTSKVKTSYNTTISSDFTVETPKMQQTIRQVKDSTVLVGMHIGHKTVENWS